MEINDIRNIVVREIENSGKKAEVELDDELLGHGLIDSMTLIGIVSGLEQRFGIEIDGDLLSVDNFRSIRSIHSTLLSIRIRQDGVT